MPQIDFYLIARTDLSVPGPGRRQRTVLYQQGTYRAHCWTLAADLRSSRRAGISTGRQQEHDWRPRSQQCCADTCRSGQCAKQPHAALLRPSARRLLDGHVVSVYRDAPGYQVNSTPIWLAIARPSDFCYPMRYMGWKYEGFS